MSSSTEVPGDQPDQARAAALHALGDTTISFGSIQDDVVTAPGLTAEEQAAVAALPRTSALLVMRRGQSGGSRFLLDADRTVAGRSESSDIFLDDVTVSRKHAEFIRELDDFKVRDIGSLNGTYVNRTRIDSTLLKAGDEVQIGKYRMLFYPSPRQHEVAADGPVAG
jgi:pSer/pThr/pTyr-binding forkhead associated (FHA) protein